MTVGYICVTDTLYRVSKVGNKETPPYEEFEEDTVFVLKIFFPNTLLLWTTLWLVKFALLLHCRRLIDRRPHYIAAWWIIVGITSLFYVGCVVTEFTSSVVVACLPTFGLLLPSQTTSPSSGFPSSTPHSKIGHRERMQKNGMVLQSRGSQHGFQGPIIEGNASRERLKSTDVNFSHNGVLVTTTLNVDGSTDTDEDSTHKSSLPDCYSGHMV
ncbi:MAG: hypothetical protein Q9226_006728 [Calogaya cf. arnoldii]